MSQDPSPQLLERVAGLLYQYAGLVVAEDRYYYLSARLRALAAQRHAVALRFCQSLQAEYLQAMSPDPLNPQG